MSKELLWKSTVVLHSIYADFDQSLSLEVRADFLVTSNIFGKVWQNLNLKALEISGELLSLFQSLRSIRFYQRVVLNSQSSRVPQGSIFEPLLSLVYVIKLPHNLESLAKLFADDTSLFCTVDSPLLSAEIMNNNLIKISEWPTIGKIVLT